MRDAFSAAESRGTPWSGQSGTVALAEAMHAGIVVSGQLYRVGNDVMIRAEVVRMPGISALGAIDAVLIAPEDPGPALDTLRQRVMGLLAIHLDPRLADWATTVERPPTYEAYREFVAGLGLTANPGQMIGTPTVRVQIEHMLRSAALDTTFMAPLIRAVGHSWSFPEYSMSQAFRDSVLRVIDQRQHLLTPVERYEVAAIKGTAADWFGAYQAMRRAADLAPDRLGELAWLAFHAGRYREAVEILERPDLPVGLSGYPWKALTASLHFLGELERELAAARRARRVNPGHREFMDEEITALAALGRIEEMEATMQESYLTGRTMEGSAPMGWSTAAVELLWHGYETEGRQVCERVVSYIQAQPEETQNKSELAEALLSLDRFEEARSIFETLAREDRGDVWLLANVAYAAAGMGDWEAVRRISAELEAVEGAQPTLAVSVFNRAQIAGVLGDCAEAVELLEEALRMGRSPVFIHRRYGFRNCRDYPPFQELAKPRG